MDSHAISRRSILSAGAAATGAAFLGGGFGAGQAYAVDSVGSAAGLEFPVTWMTGYDSQSFLTYPHHNGFFLGGSRVVIRKQDFPSTLPVYLNIYNMETGEFQPLPERKPGRPMLGGYFDINYRTGMLVIPESAAQAALDGTNVRVWAIDLNRLVRTGEASWQEIFQLPPNTTAADTMVGINPAGTKIALSIMSPAGSAPNPQLPGDRHCRIVEVDIRTGRSRALVEHDKLSNHVHYSPANPEWIMFSREGDVNQHTERIWGYHPVYAPHGRNVGNQLLPNGKVLRVAHERASFDEEATVAVNYANPRSLYKFYFDGRTPVELAQGWFEHCDVSRDGRFVVSDIAGSERPGATSLDIIDLAQGNAVTRVYTGIVRGLNHPRHVHPLFSPNGRYVFFNDPDPADRNAGGLRVGMVDLRPNGFSDGGPIILGRVNTEVPNRRHSSGSTFLDEVYRAAPFARPLDLRLTVESVIRRWQWAKLLSDLEANRVRQAIGG